jgi:polysaccharide deacetylase 2 family uncharacterized protein YibQ
MRKSLWPPLVFLLSLLVLLAIFVLSQCPAKKPGPSAAQRSAPETKAGLAAIATDRGGSVSPLEKSAAPSARPTGQENMAAIIIDDLGYNPEAARGLCAMGQPLTVSILPLAPSTRETGRLAHACGLEIMLHLPLEPLEKSAGPVAQGTITSEMTEEEIRKEIDLFLEDVPWCRGVNNHEGSKITEDSRMMAMILRPLKDKGLYFIDSRTSKDSVALEVALEVGVPAAPRQVFLDDSLEENAIKAKLEELFALAREKGRAIAIGHPKKQTIEALGKYLGLARSRGVKLVFVSDIIASENSGGVYGYRDFPSRVAEDRGRRPNTQ